MVDARLGYGSPTAHPRPLDPTLRGFPLRGFPLRGGSGGSCQLTVELFKPYRAEHVERGVAPTAVVDPRIRPEIEASVRTELS